MYGCFLFGEIGWFLEKYRNTIIYIDTANALVVYFLVGMNKNIVI